MWGILLRVKGGLDVESDGRVHGTFLHNPSSLRLSMANPSLHQIPRGTGSEYERYVKDMFVAPPGHKFVERDFSAVEAVLVGYFAGSPNYIRFAKLGVHAYLTSHIIGKPVDLKQSDSDIRTIFKELKSTYPVEYSMAKVIVHMSNYMGSPARIFQLFAEAFPSAKEAKRLQDMYHGLFPEIRVWHRALCDRVDGTKLREGEALDPWTLGVCYAKNPFGYCHRFYDVLSWEKIGDEWVSSFGEDAKRLISFLPQSTAAAIIKQAAKRIFYETPWVGQHLRLLIHDSIMFECPDSEVDKCLEVSREMMEAPIPELPLDPAWQMGTSLSILTEAKVGQSWGSMH